jgi:hypothetical protein
MTEHTFQESPSEKHNDRWFYFCGTCNAARTVVHPTPNGMFGLFVVPIDAEKFTTCEAAFAEAERQREWEAAREKQRQIECSEERERSAAFFANHAENRFYWVRVEGELTIARLLREAYDGRPTWHCLVGGDDDEGQVCPPFDDVVIVKGPIEEPT